MFKLIALFLFVFVGLSSAWASQDAMVIVPRAIIFSDKEMMSPIGFVSRGKKLKVGKIPRNRAQVYPIAVSGKVAYIRVIDVTTEKESMNSDRLVAERFQNSTGPDLDTKVSLSYFNFNSKMQESVEGVSDSFGWNGLSLKGEVLLKNRFNFYVLTNYMMTESEDVSFKVFELGAGSAYRLLDTKKWKGSVYLEALFIPFSSYEVGSDFRVKSLGYTLGSGFNLQYIWGEHWGLDAQAGLYRTSMFEFSAPSPYEKISPVFTGSRISLGVNYFYE